MGEVDTRQIQDEVVRQGKLQALMHGKWRGVEFKLREVAQIVKRHWSKVSVEVDLLEEPGQPIAWKVEVAGQIVLRVCQDGVGIKIKTE